LTDDDLSETLEHISHLIRTTLLCDQVVPIPLRRSMTLGNGTVTFTVDGEFKTSLVLEPSLEGTPNWVILNVDILVEPNTESYPHLPAKLQDYQIKNLIQATETKMRQSDTLWPLIVLYEQLRKSNRMDINDRHILLVVATRIGLRSINILAEIPLEDSSSIRPARQVHHRSILE
jgi:D-ribose pyranose/furanose isomerase RbsD